MSSVNPSPTPTHSEPASPSQSSNDNSSPASNSLYLFTFLTTLLLLLAVSCGIVLRSFILRRRFRRRVEAAIAAGVLLPEQVDALRRRGPQIGDKPKMWEVRIDGPHKEGYEPSSPSPAEDEWSNIMPVSAVIIPGSQAGAVAPAPVPVPAPQQFSAQPLNSRRRFWWLRAPDTTPTPLLPTTAPPPSAPAAPEPGHSTVTPSGDDRLQLTVLIAMPNPSAPHHLGSPLGYSKGKEASNDDRNDDDDDDEIPEVVFGVAEAPWEAGPDWKPDVGKTEFGGDNKSEESPSSQ